jgi:hypothetical protein
MAPVRTLPGGQQEWSCTRCSRRLLLRRPPASAKTVLDPGDETAPHVGGTGGLVMGAARPQPPATGGLSGADRAWLTEQGIDSGHGRTP